jgi:sugar transferase (PEP-CTERM/EpsH1 system associated)
MDTPARKPAVCQVLHTLNVGGAEVLAARLARRLRDRFRFLFACLDEVGTLGDELRAKGFPVYDLQRRPGLDWRCMFRLARLLRRERVDIIQAHQYTPFFYSSMGRLPGRRPLLFTEHGRHQPDYPRPKRIFANRLLLGRRDRVVAVGNAVKDALIANEGIAADRIAVIYNGIDLEPYRNGSHTRESVRQELGIGSDELILIQVARLDYLKDHATAVRTLEHVRQQRPDARLLLVGEGPEESKIRQLTRQANLADAVQFLGLRKDVPRLLRAADFLLLTSISEGIPLTVIEGMAAGLPVVATRVGGMAEVVRDGDTGLLAPVGDGAALAKQVLRLAGDAELRRRIGQSGRARACADFAESRMHDSYVCLYEEMLRG